LDTGAEGLPRFPAPGDVAGLPLRAESAAAADAAWSRQAYDADGLLDVSRLNASLVSSDPP